MAVYSSLGEAQFWIKYSIDGKKLGISQIHRKISAEARKVDEEVAETARREYGDTFQDYFSYRRSGRLHVLSKAKAIAHRYHDHSLRRGKPPNFETSK
jgi:hypothetical protein